MIALAEFGGKQINKKSIFVTPGTVLAAFGQKLSYKDIMEGLYLFDKDKDQERILNGIAQKQKDFWSDIEVVRYYFQDHWQLPGMREHSKKILNSLNMQNNDMVLDLACGWGRVAQEILNLQINFKYIGIDFADNMLERAREEVQKFGDGRVDLINHDLSSNIPCPDNFADRVLANWGIVYLSQEQLQNALQEVNRVLKPGGIFVCAAIVEGANFILLALKSMLSHPIEAFKKRKIIKKGMGFGAQIKKLFPLYTKEQLSLMITEAGKLEIIDQYSTISGRSLTIVAQKLT